MYTGLSQPLLPGSLLRTNVAAGRKFTLEGRGSTADEASRPPDRGKICSSLQAWRGGESRPEELRAGRNLPHYGASSASEGPSPGPPNAGGEVAPHSVFSFFTLFFIVVKYT